MPFPIAALIGASALGGLGGLFGQKKKTDQTNTFESIDTPFGTPGVGEDLRSAFLQRLLSRLSEEPELPSMDFSGLRTGGITAINRGSNIASQALANRLAERGLSFSPGVATSAFGTLEAGRGSQISDLLNNLSFRQAEFQSQLPLIKENLIRQRLSDILSASPLFTGSRRTGSERITGTNVVGGGIGGALQSGASTLFTGLGIRALTGK